MATTLEVCEKVVMFVLEQKSSSSPSHGLFQPLPILTSLWSPISKDFIIDFPPFSVYDSIFTMVNYFDKDGSFHFMYQNITSEGATKIFFDHFFNIIVFLKISFLIRGLNLHSNFWKQLFELFNVTMKLSSTFHPQTNGQIEQVNQVLEQYL